MKTYICRATLNICSLSCDYRTKTNDFPSIFKVPKRMRSLGSSLSKSGIKGLNIQPFYGNRDAE